MFCGTGWLDVVPCVARALAAAGVEAQVVARDPARPLAPQLRDVDVTLPSNALFGAEEIAAAPRLRLIQQPAVGHEGIDLAAARARGVPVCNAPGMNADAVAQAALLLVLALARRLPAAQRAFGAARIGAPLGVELTGKRLGVVGLGETGGRLAGAARALGMQVEAVRSAHGRGGLLVMLGRADVVSIHCPLTPATRGLFDDEAFAAMRPGALLVNVARGAILDRGALERALAAGRLGGVGLDVFWEEPWDPHEPLFARDDVIALPHVAGSTEEAFARIAGVVAQNTRALLDGGPLAHRIDGA
ncbi:2-hydroxyacid dehydrogenase [Sorangium cellulosum]|uniref:2-hydroxyacid dehydrogenase n=2 Tax=Sorangium cellulosum TaxID=56 RepID=A0A2L0ETL6_SORCE|nr:2-hydroxyacid dehydrogenase [Sorangium cellulosum]